MIATLTLVLAPALTAGDVHFVDFEGRVGFASVQEAVDAAQSGDTVLLQAPPPTGSSTLFSFAIDGKSLSIIGLNPPGSGEHVHVGDVHVYNLAADQKVLLRGLHIARSQGFVGATVVNCTGSVRMETCAIGASGWAFNSPQAALALDGALDVSLHGCVIQGTPRGAIRASRSRVTIFESTIHGGSGSPAQSYDVAHAGPGPTAIEIVDRSFLWLGASEVEGGTGGWTECIHNSACTAITGDGGTALQVEAGCLAVAVESTLLPGQPGSHTTWGAASVTIGNVGTTVMGSLAQIPGTQRRLDAPRSVLSGELASVAIEGTPGEQVDLFVTPGAGHRYLGPFTGPWLANGVAAVGPYDLGVIPASGRLEAQVVLPAVADDGAEAFTLQATCRTAPTRFRVTPPRAVTVVGEGAPLIEPVDVLYVDASAHPGGNGHSWAHAASDLRDAIARLPRNAGAGTEVWLAGGIYTVAPSSLPLDRERLVIDTPLQIYGGFDGTESLRGERDPAAHPTVLTGDLLGDDGPNAAHRSDNSTGLLRAFGHGASDFVLRIDGVRVTGSTTHPALEVVAGGLWVEGCSFDENHALNHGGAITSFSTVEVPHEALVVRRSRFVRNSGVRGGAICSYNSNPGMSFADLRVEGCEFTANTSGNAFLNTFARSGAVALFRPDAWIEMRDSTLLDNDLDAPSWVTITATGVSAEAGVRMDLHNNLTAHRGIEDGTHAMWSCADPTSGDTASFNRVPAVPSTWSSATNIALDPLFVDRLGPDGSAGTGDEDARLAPGSPCVDAGNSFEVALDLATDLDGRPRFADDPNAPNVGVGGTRIVDMGAYER